MAIFVVQLRYRNDPQRLEVRPQHREYLATLHADGRLVAAGPWADETGALLIYDVADEETLHRILEDDPYSRAEVYDLVELKEWRPSFPFPSAS